MAGEHVEALRVDRRGAGGERTHAVTHHHKGRDQPLTAREAPRLLAWRAAYAGADVDPAAPPLARLTAPDGADHAWEGARMRVGDLELELLHPCVRCAIPTRDPDTQVKWRSCCAT